MSREICGGRVEVRVCKYFSEVLNLLFIFLILIRKFEYFYNFGSFTGKNTRMNILSYYTLVFSSYSRQTFLLLKYEFDPL